MNPYELVIVLDGAITPAKKKKEIENIEKTVKLFEGKVVEIEEWGVKDLAYSIKKKTSGLFLIFTLELTSQAAKELPAKLRLEEQLLRHLLVKKQNRKVDSNKTKKKGKK